MRIIVEELSKKDNKKKFRELVMKYHPDKGGDDKIMKRLNTAADDGDYAFEQLRDELVGKKKPKDTYSWKNTESKSSSSRGTNEATKDLIEILKKEFKDDKDVERIKSGRTIGSMFIVYVVLKDGKRVAIEYTMLEHEDKIETLLLDRQGEQLSVKLGETTFDKLAAPYARNIPSSVRTWIKHKDDAYVDDSWRHDD